MVSKKKMILIILIAIIAVTGIYFLISYYQGSQNFKGEHNVLVLCSDISEQRPGIGSVDMAFVIHVKDGSVGNITPVYPGGMYSKSLEPPIDLRAEGVDHWYLHDSLWSASLENGTNVAQTIVEENTGIKTDMVAVITPSAIDAMVDAVGPVYSNGQLVNGSSLTFLREDQNNNGATRGDAIEGLGNGIKNAASNPIKKIALIKTVMEQYSQDNIQVVPKDKFTQFLSYEGLNNIL